MNNATKGKHNPQAIKAGIDMLKLSVLTHIIAQVNPVRVAKLATLTPFFVSFFIMPSSYIESSIVRRFARRIYPVNPNSLTI